MLSLDTVGTYKIEELKSPCLSLFHASVLQGNNFLEKWRFALTYLSQGPYILMLIAGYFSLTSSLRYEFLNFVLI